MKYLFLFLLVLCSFASLGQCRFSAIVDRCMDGDTFDASVDLHFKISHVIRIRLASLNAPEMKGADSIKARASKTYLENLILGKTVYFDTKERQDIYGRYIETVYLSPVDTVSVNSRLVKSGYAKAVKY